jgi:hypothetical protein
MDQVLTSSFHSKIVEQIEKTLHLISLLPEKFISWQPPIPGAFTAAAVLGHLLECLSGFCAVLLAAEPERLGHFALLRELPVKHECTPLEARERISIYAGKIQEGFSILNDADLERTIPTVFVPGGESLLTLFLGNLEHYVNHKHQLFMYLQLMGVPAKSPDLYQFRGQGPSS